MILVALAVIVATGVGVAAERRTADGGGASEPASALRLMLYVLLPFVSFVNFSHLHLSVGAGVGLLVAYVAIGIAGVLAWAVARLRLHLPSPSVGALICCVISVNTGYLGLPMAFALLGARGFTSAVAYDQLVSGPMFLVAAFAVGAAFGGQGGESARERLRAFATRNPPLWPWSPGC